MKCELCTYEWLPRVDNPKACPRCKRRFDYPDSKIDIQKIQKNILLQNSGADTR